MSFIPGLAEVTGAVNAVRGLIEAFRSPSPKRPAPVQQPAQPVDPKQFAEELHKRIGIAVDRIIQKYDADGNGTLTADELGVTAELFQALDSDSSGQLDKTELTQAFANRTRALSLRG